jgi:undecaprenyl diphosphate synthase
MNHFFRRGVAWLQRQLTGSLTSTAPRTLSMHQSDSGQLNQSPSSMPQHIAMIMDGNGRWAQRRHLPRTAGHIKGVGTVKDMVKACDARGIRYLTLFAFSSENWLRPIEEVSMLMGLFVQVLENELEGMHRHGVRLRIVGDTSAFDPQLQTLIAKSQQETAQHTGLTLTICANYGGRWDMLNAIQQHQTTHPNTPITETGLAPYLAFYGIPDPDLLIRTGGEQRISNFMLWQLAYSELYFTETFWPDFSEASLDQALADFAQRDRRFGRIKSNAVTDINTHTHTHSSAS